MKTTHKIAVLILAFLSVITLVSFDKNTEISLSPSTAPTGHTLTSVSTYDFSEQSFPYIYSGTYSLGYGTLSEKENNRFFLTTCGGGKQPQFLAYAASGDDLTEADWITLYIDTTGLQNSSNFSLEFRLYMSSSPTTSQNSTSTLVPLYLSDGALGYIRSANGTWTSARLTDSKLPLGEDFCGYVALPLSSFAHKNEMGKKYIGSNKIFSDVINSGYKYLTRIQFFCSVADMFESQTKILLDDISFSATGEAHTHSFVTSNTIAPTCNEKGYTVQTCTACNESVIKDIRSAKGHTFGVYKSDADGIAYRICTACNHVDTNPNITGVAKGNDDLVTVTFEYGEAGGEAKVKFCKGSVITAEDIPVKMTYTDRFTYQFNCWTSDKAGITPKDPIGMTADTDMTFYARWLIATYAEKYISAVSIIAFNGGAYTWEEGKVVVYGNSNMGLYHALESDFAAAGLPAYNNSISGSTSYDMIEYFKACVLTYRPKYIVTNITTNDMSYYNMSERQIIQNMQKLYAMVREYLPDTVLLVAAGNPLPGRTEYRPSIERINRQMAIFCEKNENCEFVDWYEKVFDYAEKYPTGWDTWTHLNQAGLKYIFSDVINKIKECKTK